MDRAKVIFNDLIKDNGIGTLQKQAQDSIVNMLIRDNIKGIRKCMNLGEYDMESLCKGNIIPGNIYCFVYNTQNPTTYIIDGNKFPYFDKLPVVFVMKESTDTITGINLNFCSYDLRGAIINTIYNMDEDFFCNTDIETPVVNGKVMQSDSIRKFLQDPDCIRQITKKLSSIYNIPNNPNIFIRTYSKQMIRRIRMLEYWQWKYVPFLKYDNSANKQDILDSIYKATRTNIKFF